MTLFVSFVTKVGRKNLKSKPVFDMSAANKEAQARLGSNEAVPVQPEGEDCDAKQNQIILRSRDCVHRMEIASLMRYAFLKTCRGATGRCKSLLFFTPCEELNGGSIFQKLAANYNVI